MLFIKRLFVVLLFLTLLFAGVFGWKYTQTQKMALNASIPQPPAVIAADLVQRTSWRPSLSAIGSLVAQQGVFVSNEIAGQIIDIRFVSGQAVEAGQLLVQLDDEVDRADRANLVAAQRLAQLEFQRAVKLVKENTMSQSNYDQARATLDSATAAVKSQEARIRKKAMRAPFGGLLGIRQVDLGQYLAPGTPVVALQTLDPVYVDFNLPERYLSKLAVGQTVEVSVQAYPGRQFTGSIRAISARISTATRSVPVRATLANPEQLLRPGMFAEVHTLLPVRDDVLTLAAHAVTYNPYGESVFVIEHKGDELVAQRRQIETGEVHDGRVEIVAGLKAGDRVVSAGHNKLRNGQTVRIDNSIELSGRIDTP